MNRTSRLVAVSAVLLVLLMAGAAALSADPIVISI
jgi:hypothetical protein